MQITHIPNPASVSVITAGYTIPDGRYARAVVNVIGSGTFTIGGITALAGTQNSVLGSDNLKIGTKTISVGGSNLGVANTLISNGGTTIDSQGAAGSAFTEATQQHNLVHDYFLPAGTVIGGTGTWRAVVEEYLG